MEPQDRPQIVSTDRQRAVLQLLIDAGFTESGVRAGGERFEDGPPEGLTITLDMALSAYATADHLLGILTWEQQESATPAVRTLARKIAALAAAPPA